MKQIKYLAIFITFMCITGFTYGYKNNSQTGKPDLVTTKLVAADIPSLPIYRGCTSIPSYTDNNNGSITITGTQVNIYPNATFSGQPISYNVAGGTYTFVDGATNYLAAVYNNGLPEFQVITDVTFFSRGDYVPIFTVERFGNELHITNWDSAGSGLPEKTFYAAARTLRYLRQDGLALSEYGTRNIDVTSGTVYIALSVPITLAHVASATNNYSFYYHVAGIWTRSSQTQYNNTQYDDGTTLQSLTGTHYAVNWVYRGVEDGAEIYVTLGSGNYTLAQAQASQPPIPPVQISSHCLLIGRIIVASGATTATQIDSAFNVSLTTSGITSHADLTHLDYATAGHTGFVPATRTVNGYALSSDIVISTSDIGASPVSGPGSSQTFNTGSLTVGTGNGTSAGIYLGNYVSGYGGIWTTISTPTTSNFIIASNNTDTYLNGGSSVNINVNNTTVGTWSSTGLAVHSGTNSVYRCVGGTNDGALNWKTSGPCPSGTNTQTFLKID